MSDTIDIQAYLDNYLTRFPPGGEGDRAIRDSLPVDPTELTFEALAGSMSDEQINSWLDYAGWNLWDVIRSRSAEGESGLIPRQEYETLGFVQLWERSPELFRRMTERIGVEGLIELGGRQRTEIGLKANFLRNWAVPVCPLMGRGILIGMGVLDPGDRREDIETIIQTGRRIAYGAWGGDGPQFCASRGSQIPILEGHWIERFFEEREAFDGPEAAAAFRQFNAKAELFGFLFHYDNRAGVNDTGLYATPDGGFMLVRDLFLNEPEYAWSHHAHGLPYAVTEAMTFAPGTPVEFVINDLATTFTEPADYQRHVSAVAVYARDEWDTPMSAIRQIDAAERKAIADRCGSALLGLYRHIAGNDREANIHAGVEVYVREMTVPHLREVGMWNEQAKRDLHEVAAGTQAAWPVLSGPQAAEILGPVLIMGKGFPHLDGTLLA